MIFRQLFDPAQSAMTYLIGDPESREAVVIDPFKYQVPLILALLAEQQLRLAYVVRTHVHRLERINCDDLCPNTGAIFVVGAGNANDIPGLRVGHSAVLNFGSESLEVLETPGHTPGCVSYHWRDRVFCGDVMELGGCGQPEGETNAGAMYDSVRKHIFSLPGETLIFPGHDYAGRTVSSVAEERQRNTAFSTLSRDRFIERMEQVKKRPVLSATFSTRGREVRLSQKEMK